jgi:hypothetical protein
MFMLSRHSVVRVGRSLKGLWPINLHALEVELSQVSLDTGLLDPTNSLWLPTEWRLRRARFLLNAFG